MTRLNTSDALYTPVRWLYFPAGSYTDSVLASKVTTGSEESTSPIAMGTYCLTNRRLYCPFLSFPSVNKSKKKITFKLPRFSIIKPFPFTSSSGIANCDEFFKRKYQFRNIKNNLRIHQVFIHQEFKALQILNGQCISTQGNMQYCSGTCPPRARPFHLLASCSWRSEKSTSLQWNQPEPVRRPAWIFIDKAPKLLRLL